MSNKKPTPNVFLKEARQLQREGNLHEAIRVYRQAIENNPTFSWYYYELGDALRAVGNLEQSINSYRKAIEINPRSAWFNCRLAEVLSQQENLDEAIAFLKNAINYGSGYPEFTYKLGKVLEKKGNWSQAIAEYKKAIELDSKNYRYYISLANTFAKLQDWDNAMSAYRAATHINPYALDSESDNVLINKPGVSFQVDKHTISQSDLDSDKYAKVIFKGKEIYISDLHFHPLSEIDIAKKLFKNSIRRVHVEVFSYCNRKCVFCPNQYGTRMKENQYLDEKIYLNILNELASIDYDGVFGFHQYNEPLADKIILQRITQVKYHLPQANIIINTNGDYLDFNYLEELQQSGLMALNISIYGPKNGIFDEQYILEKMSRMADKLELKQKQPSHNKGFGYTIREYYKDILINIWGRNIASIGFNRGELVDVGPAVINRSCPCFYPFEDLSVDYRGNILPCCNVYADLPEHHQYIIGNLNDGRSIFEHYVDKQLVNWRKNLIRFFPKGSPCQTCSRLEFPELVTLKNVNSLENLAQIFMEEKP